MNAQNNINAFTDLAHFGAMRHEATQNPNSAVAEVAKEFEALFIEMMLSSARKASIKGGMFESNALEIYREMFDSQAARVLSEQRTLGFEKAISRFVGTEESPNRQPTLPAPGTAAVKGDSASDNDVSHMLRETPRLPARRADLPLPNYHASSTAQHLKADGHSSPAAQIDDGRQKVARHRPISMDAASTAHNLAPEFFGSHEQLSFSQRLAPYAKDAAEILGTDPDILIAQAALESGWGKHIIPGADGKSSNNLFGIKANSTWRGASTDVKTFEFMGGRPIKTRASFRSYSDIKSSFDDYVKFVSENPRYQQAIENAPDGDKYIQELAKAGYATDPKYAEKIISIKNRISQMNSQANSQTKGFDSGKQLFNPAASTSAN